MTAWIKPMLRPLKRRIDSALFACGPLIRGLGCRHLTRSGVRVDIRSPLISDMTVAGLFWGRYEAPERRLVTRRLRRDLPVIELGASLGFISSLVARRTKHPVQIAVEANPLLVPLLTTNLRANCGGRVRVQTGAIDYSGAAKVHLRVDANCSLCASVAGPPEGAALPQDGVSVPVTTLGAIVAEAALEDFALVCDIEGAELQMIERETPEVVGRCQQMVIELHHCHVAGRAITPVELADRIRDRWGMRAVAREGNVWFFERVDGQALGPAPAGAGATVLAASQGKG